MSHIEKNKIRCATKNFRKKSNGKTQMQLVAIVLCAILLITGLSWYLLRGNSANEKKTTNTPSVSAGKSGVDEVLLMADQVEQLKVGSVGDQSFQEKNSAIGIIDFNQENAVQVFSPYQGRIGKVLVRAGDDVAKGQVLYTVQIPDLAAAASTLIATAGTLKNANQTLARAKSLAATDSIPLKELQQNISDQQAADAAYRAARKSMSLFGLNGADVDAIEKGHKVDTEMAVHSPFAGRVITRNAQEGLLVQPGNTPAPVMVANLQNLWMVASVPESDSGKYKKGQNVEVKVSAYPDKTFNGTVSYISDMVDPTSHRITVRANVADPGHLLKPQMQANFNVSLSAPVNAIAVPENALVREGDGSMTVWVTTDNRHFKRRIVKVGMVQNGMAEIKQGLSVGEKIARDQALFLSNLYSTAAN